MNANQSVNTLAPVMAQIKERMRASWMAGDFGVIAKTSAVGASRFIAGLPVAPDMRVLDVACGTGNTAIPLAKLGCVVTGVDIAANLIEQARQRALDEGVSITFNEGDAEALPYDDAEFDAVVSMFGAMFAPRPHLVVAEFARVLKPGGLLAMANWTPEGFTGRMFFVGSKHVPPPPGILPPVQWGDEAIVSSRLAGAFEQIETTVVPVEFDLPMPPQGAVDFFRTYFGPTKMAFEKLDERGQKAMEHDLVALWAGANTSADPERTLVPSAFLKVTARRK